MASLSKFLAINLVGFFFKKFLLQEKIGSTSGEIWLDINEPINHYWTQMKIKLISLLWLQDQIFAIKVGLPCCVCVPKCLIAQTRKIFIAKLTG